MLVTTTNSPATPVVVTPTSHCNTKNKEDYAGQTHSGSSSDRSTEPPLRKIKKEEDA